MRNFVVSLVLSILFSTVSSFAHEGHDHGTQSSNAEPAKSAEVCAKENSEVCVHVHFLTPVDSATEAEFVVHVEGPSDAEAQNVAVDLWMDMGDGHGHGSAPVEVAATEETNHYHVQNAWFVMAGPWLIRVHFVLEGKKYNLQVPVAVTK